MKGRLYDAEIGRFISADPFIQAPALTQSYNRYTYVMNNPLSYTDPTGYFWGIGSWFKRNIKKYGRTILALGATILTGGWALAAGWGAMGAGFAGGFVGGAISTGSLKGAIRGGLFGMLSAGMANSLAHGTGMENFWASSFGGPLGGKMALSIAHGASQGAITAIRGGKFGAGFLSAFAGKVSGFATKGMGKYTRMATSVMVGGTVSAAVGGKFANGARTAAFVAMFNDFVAKFDKKISWITGRLEPQVVWPKPMQTGGTFPGGFPAPDFNPNSDLNALGVGYEWESSGYSYDGPRAGGSWYDGAFGITNMNSDPLDPGSAILVNMPSLGLTPVGSAYSSFASVPLAVMSPTTSNLVSVVPGIGSFNTAYGIGSSWYNGYKKGYSIISR